MELGLLKLMWDALLGVALLTIGWLWKSLHKRIDDIEKRNEDYMNRSVSEFATQMKVHGQTMEKINELVTSIRINYVHKEEMKDIRREILDRFDKLEDYMKGDK